VTVPPEAGLEDVARVLATHRVSWLPVVDPSGHPIGVVTWRDLLAHLLPGVRPDVASVPASRSPRP